MGWKLVKHAVVNGLAAAWTDTINLSIKVSGKKFFAM